MTDYQFTVVVATYNRPELCVAAVESIFRAAANKYRVQVIVVDDCSPVPPPKFDKADVIVLRQEVNAGPGPARMRGIREAASPLVMLMDDDDQLRRDAFDIVSQRLAGLPRTGDWLVVQFASSNAQPTASFQYITFDGYMKGLIKGDYNPVFHRDRFLASGLVYPSTRLGGEHLLWWRLAEQAPIPTWQDVLVDMGEDAALRLTDIDSQVLRAEEHLALAEMTWAQFGSTLKKIYPQQATRVLMGGVSYAALAGQRSRAFPFLKSLKSPKYLLMGAAIIILPRRFVEKLFRSFRAKQLGQAS